MIRVPMTHPAGRERGILFQGWGVQAIRADMKTQTRRVLRDQHPNWRFVDLKNDLGYSASRGHLWAGFLLGPDSESAGYFKCPYGQPGDLLWVRETWAAIWTEHEPNWEEGQTIRDVPHRIEYRADSGTKYPGEWPDDMGDDAECPKWRPSIHMPRWACRLTLRITDVRVQRIQEISAQDAVAEGLPPLSLSDGGVGEFRRGWDCINAKRGYGWHVNPWVWALTFERTELFI